MELSEGLESCSVRTARVRCYEASDSATQPSTPEWPPNVGTAPDSDSGCSCCPSLGDSDQKLTQRRSLSPSHKRSSLGSETVDLLNSRGAKVMQERALWTILLLACTALAFSVLPLEGTSGLASGFLALREALKDHLAPSRPFVWRLQWRLSGRPDPRPLWDVQMLGSKTEWPHGSANGFAATMNAGTARKIAVVGNGPLSAEQRADIGRADGIVRFNAMNNKLPEERVDVWVVRHNGIPPHWFWGFQQLADAEIQHTIQQAKAVLFLGGSPANESAMRGTVDDVLFWFPDMRGPQAQQVNVTGYSTAYEHMFSNRTPSEPDAATTMPSSGLLGLLAVLAAVGEQVRIDLYGFNWSLKSYSGHKMSKEEAIIREVRQQHPNIHEHPTACAGLYSCEAVCDTNQFRLAVDHEMCQEQVDRARQGKPTRFIDQHTLFNLDWHPELKDELKLTMPKNIESPAEQHAWIKKQTTEMLLKDDSPLYARQESQTAAELGQDAKGVSDEHHTAKHKLGRIFGRKAAVPVKPAKP